jgi:hypothetical protein
MPTTESVRPLGMRRSFAGRLCLGVLVLAPTLAHGQHIRRTDGTTQAAVIESGLSAETTCPAETALSGQKQRRYSLAGSLAAVLDGRRDDDADRVWSGWGLTQLRAHGSHTGCRLDWRIRALGSTRTRIGADGVVVGSLPGVLGGAVHLFGEAGAASDSRAEVELDAPRHTEIGVAYTSFNLYRTLLPWFYKCLGLDVRLRLSAGASQAYGETERIRAKASVPDLSAIFVGKVEEKGHGGVLFSARLVPDYVPDVKLWEHTTVLMYGFRSDAVPPSWLMARSPYVTVRYTGRHLGHLQHDREIALSAGLTLL